jgi:hypothetical protein
MLNSIGMTTGGKIVMIFSFSFEELKKLQSGEQLTIENQTSITIFSAFKTDEVAVEIMKAANPGLVVMSDVDGGQTGG